jgi:hypothetical protein
MPPSNDNADPAPAKPRNMIKILLGLFVAGLIGVFVWANGLAPANKTGELNSNPKDVSQDKR